MEVRIINKFRKNLKYEKIYDDEHPDINYYVVYDLFDRIIATTDSENNLYIQELTTSNHEILTSLSKFLMELQRGNINE